MPAIDKWPDIIQWIAGFGVLVGGAIAGFFGTKIAGRKSPLPDDDRAQVREEERQRIEQARLDERKRVELESQITEARIMAAIMAGLRDNRSEFYKAFEKYHNEQQEENGRVDDKISRLDDRVRTAENHLTGMRADVESLKARRPRQ